MERKLPQVEWQNDDGACWTCLKHKRVCDRTLPYCKTCIENGVKCRGFGVRFLWPANATGVSRSRGIPGRRGKQAARRPSETGLGSAEASLNMSMTKSPSLLPSEENFFMQHFLRNFARVALAIDYEENGYRCLLPMAIVEPGLMSAVLAVAASHYSRWQKTTDMVSRKYRRAALQALRDRFNQPELIQSPTTLACMLALVTYEVFSGSSRWQGHHEAIRGWVRSRPDCSDLDPFIKAWVCLIDTQCALNTGEPAMPELRTWMDGQDAPESGENSVDALFGCSSRLPKLMWDASQLYSTYKHQQVSREEIQTRAEGLQTLIYTTKVVLDSEPSVMILCQETSRTLSVTVDLDRDELRRRMVATAEIFRHACHIYVYRIGHEPIEALSRDMKESLQAALELLAWVPDSLGPGANLGWCLMVIGAELDLSDQRDYIRSRWPDLDLLGIENYKSARTTLEEVWKQRDQAHHGQSNTERWQDIMHQCGQTQILV